MVGELYPGWTGCTLGSMIGFAIFSSGWVWPWMGIWWVETSVFTSALNNFVFEGVVAPLAALFISSDWFPGIASHAVTGCSSATAGVYVLCGWGGSTEVGISTLLFSKLYCFDDMAEGIPSSPGNDSRSDVRALSC